MRNDHIYSKSTRLSVTILATLPRKKWLVKAARHYHDRTALFSQVSLIFEKVFIFLLLCNVDKF